MAKKAQLLGIWLRAMLDFRERESCFLLTDVRSLPCDRQSHPVRCLRVSVVLPASGHVPEL